MSSYLNTLLPAKAGLAFTLILGLSACDLGRINTIEEFMNTVVGKEYTNTEVADTIIVDGVPYVVNRRDFKDLRSGSKGETGTDFTVSVGGSILSCDADKGLARCINEFRDRIPKRIKTQRGAEKEGDY